MAVCFFSSMAFAFAFSSMLDMSAAVGCGGLEEDGTSLTGIDCDFEDAVSFACGPLSFSVFYVRDFTERFNSSSEFLKPFMLTTVRISRRKKPMTNKTSKKIKPSIYSLLLDAHGIEKYGFCHSFMEYGLQ